jgi:hypothetical protein
MVTTNHTLAHLGMREPRFCPVLDRIFNPATTAAEPTIDNDKPPTTIEGSNFHFGKGTRSRVIVSLKSKTLEQKRREDL